MNIPIAKTYLTDDEIKSVLEPLKSGWLVQGPKVKEFERSWCEFTKAKYSIAVTNCTSALHISLKALNFGLGDKAIVPAFSWISTANVVEHLGGEVVFADIDLSTFNIDIKSLENLVRPDVKAIIPVHLFGLAANMNGISKFAEKHNLFVIEDAACGFGSKLNDKHVGNFGDTGCFSFHPRKAITTGEGGMITTNNSYLADKIRCFVNHGACKTDLQRHIGAKPYLLADHVEAGFNYRMTDIQGALGFAQMKRSKNIIEERIKLAERYNNAFKNLEWLQVPKTENNFIHSYQSYPFLYNAVKVREQLKKCRYEFIEKTKLSRNNLMDKLQKQGISTRPATHAIHMLNFYKEKYQILPEELPNAFAANNCSISLPLFNGMKIEEQDYVIENILDHNGKI